jgi:hypothetical protein
VIEGESGGTGGERRGLEVKCTVQGRSSVHIDDKEIPRTVDLQFTRELPFVDLEYFNSILMSI